MACFKDLEAMSSLVEEPFIKDRFKNRPESPQIRIKIAGLMTTVAFQKARLLALNIHQHIPLRFSTPEIRGMLQVDWHEYVQKMKPRVGHEIWKSSKNVFVFVNEEYIGSNKDFGDYITENYVFRLPVKAGYYENLITQEYKQYIEGSGRDYVYFTFTIDNQTIGSFLFMSSSYFDQYLRQLASKPPALKWKYMIQLYTDLLPQTCKNFLDLCTGECGQTEDGVGLHYKNTLVHRIVKNGWLQCGDIELIRGGGGIAANGGVMPDESYCVPHNRRGVLSMANNGKDSNGSQFVVSLKANPWMDYYYVAFGQLVDGIETLKKIEQIPASYEKPLRRIVISRCGQYFFGEEPEMEAGPDVFVKHVSETSSPQVEGECPSPCTYIYSGYPGLKPWLDNIVDKLDDRDTISLLMAERYLGGLYSLATDYLPGMDMIPPEIKKEKARTKLNLDMSKVCPVCESEEGKNFLFNFDGPSDEEKISLICGAGKEIVACAVEACTDKVSLERISMDGVGTAQWVLELACEVAAAALARAKSIEKKSPDDPEHQSEKTLSDEAEKISAGLVTPEGILLVEEILKEALLHAAEVGKDIEDSESASEFLEG